MCLCVCVRWVCLIEHEKVFFTVTRTICWARDVFPMAWLFALIPTDVSIMARSCFMSMYFARNFATCVYVHIYVWAFARAQLLTHVCIWFVWREAFSQSSPIWYERAINLATLSLRRSLSLSLCDNIKLCHSLLFVRGWKALSLLYIYEIAVGSCADWTMFELWWWWIYIYELFTHRKKMMTLIFRFIVTRGNWHFYSIVCLRWYCDTQ